MKFKRANIIEISKKINIDYIYLDIFRQTTIERLVERANKNNLKSEQLKRIILQNAKNMFDIIIKE